MQVWPFRARNDATESLAWLTDIIPAKSAEQRIALRQEPRRYFGYSHTLTDLEYSSARAMLIANDQFLVPDWPQFIHLGSISSGSDISIPQGEIPYTDIFDGQAIIWQSSRKYEQVEVDYDSSGVASILSVADDYTDAYLVPVNSGYAIDGSSTNRLGAENNNFNVTFSVYDNTDISGTNYSQYRSLDVLTDCPVLGGGLSESMRWDYSEFDSGLSSPSYYRNRSYIELKFQMQWDISSKSEMYTLRQWLHRRKGRQKSFWLSSMAKDLEPASSIASGAITINVYSLDGISSLGRTGSFDIEIKTKAGTSFYRRVTSYASGSPIGERETFSLTIDSSLGVDVDLSEIKRISFLRCARFNADRIEINHKSRKSSFVSVICIEVPSQ